MKSYLLYKLRCHCYKSIWRTSKCDIGIMIITPVHVYIKVYFMSKFILSYELIYNKLQGLIVGNKAVLHVTRNNLFLCFLSHLPL